MLDHAHYFKKENTVPQQGDSVMDEIHKNGNVKWKAFISVILTVVVISGGVGVYALNANKEYLHPDAVRIREIEPIRRDIGEVKTDVREVRKMLTQLLVDKK